MGKKDSKETPGASPDSPTFVPEEVPSGIHDVDDTPTGDDPGPGGLPLSSIPEKIGNYRIHRILGEGGMGVVFEAEQKDPKRAVALKVIRGGTFIDEGQVRMFQREAQTLARLKHPAIASIYEAGRTEDGQHFFAMELVRGETLKHWVKARPTNGGFTPAELRTRLALFRKICDGVSYAHQRGVVHRDLKPSNVLVLREAVRAPAGSPFPAAPEIKILDFGLARITDTDVQMTTVVTDIGSVQGTLTYMSPEQLRGNADEIDLRTDVYSLGVILYEILTGRLPYEVDTKMLHKASEVICERDPRPLAKVWPGGRRVDRDIETIVGKALEKAPAQRYQSVTALGEDIERFLTHQPILARPPSAAYQLRKMIRRHKIGFAFATSLALLVTAFGATMAVQAGRIARERDRANHEAATARRVSEFLIGLFEVADPEEARGDTITARELLGRGADRIRQELSGEPVVQARMMQTIGRVYKSLGLYDESRPLLAEARRIQEGAGGADADLVATLGHLAGVLQILGDYDEARATYARALEVGEEVLAAADPEIARVLNGFGALLRITGDTAAAEPMLRRALAIDEAAYGADDVHVAESLNGLATVLFEAGELREAESLYRRALAIRGAALPDDHPDLAESLNNLALVSWRLGENERARSLFERTIAIQEKVFDPDHALLARSYANLSLVLAELGDYDGAIGLQERALVIRERKFGREHKEVATDIYNLALRHYEKGDYPQALRLHREALAIRQRVLEADHIDIAYSLEGIGSLLMEMGDFEAARPYYERALPINEKALGPDDPGLAWSLTGLGKILVETGDYGEAEDYLARALELREAAYGPGHNEVAWNLYDLGELKMRAGDPDAARRFFARGIAIFEENPELGPTHSGAAFGMNGLAEVLAAAGEAGRAEELFRRALAINEKALGPEHPDVARSLHGIAGILEARGDRAGARTYYGRALRIREQRLGPGHPDTRASRAALLRLTR